MRLRQVATVARDLAPVVDDFCSVLGVEVAYRDPGVAAFGLCNAVMPVGDTFLEVVAPQRPGTTAGRYLDRHGGDAGYMVLLQTSEDIDRFRARMMNAGVRVVWSADHRDMRASHLHPKDVGGAILSVDRPVPPESWRWAGPEWRERARTDVVTGIVGVELASEAPATMARRWGEILQLEPVPSAGEEVSLHLEGSVVRFRHSVEGRSGVTGIDLRVVDVERVIREAWKRGLECGQRQVRVGGVDLFLQGSS